MFNFFVLYLLFFIYLSLRLSNTFEFYLITNGEHCLEYNFTAAFLLVLSKRDIKKCVICYKLNIIQFAVARFRNICFIFLFDKNEGSEANETF